MTVTFASGPTLWETISHCKTGVGGASIMSIGGPSVTAISVQNEHALTHSTKATPHGALDPASSTSQP
jgi:hypothetical protein